MGASVRQSSLIVGVLLRFSLVPVRCLLRLPFRLRELGLQELTGGERRKPDQPGSGVQQLRRMLDRCALGVSMRRMLEADDIHGRRIQLDEQLRPIERHVERNLAVHVGVVLLELFGPSDLHHGCREQ